MEVLKPKKMVQFITAQEMIPQAVEDDEIAGVISVVLGFALMMAMDVAL